MVLDTSRGDPYGGRFGNGAMSTTTLERSPEKPAPSSGEPQPANHSTLVLVAFGLVYVVWGSTYLAIRVGVESLPPLLLAGGRAFFPRLFFFSLFRWETGRR